MRIKRSGVYQIVNETNGKSYVGSSKDITNRWKKWKFVFKSEIKYVSLLKKAVQKYGIEHFTFIIIEECESTKELLEARENYYIETLRPEYNILQKAYTSLGFKHSEKTLQKLREIHSNIDPDHQQKMTEAARIANIGKPRSEQTKQKISEGNIGKDMSMLRGIPRTDDVRLKVSEGIRNSEVFQQSVKARVGKSTKKSSHGNYGITWRNDSNKWIVKIKNKKYGSFKTIDEAIIKRNEILI
jgi:group I intron endonuclease